MNEAMLAFWVGLTTFALLSFARACAFRDFGFSLVWAFLTAAYAAVIVLVATGALWS